MKLKSAFIVICSFVIALLATWSAHATSNNIDLVNYANNYAEFSVGIPEAPSVRTLWADGNEKIPYIIPHIRSGAMGEVAFYETTDSQTGDRFMIEVTFLKVPATFIQRANEATLFTIIKKDLEYLPTFENINTKYDDKRNKPAKHAIVKGTTMTGSGAKEMNAEHFLVGTESILVIKAKFNSENTKHSNLYNKISDSIKYLPL